MENTYKFEKFKKLKYVSAIYVNGNDVVVLVDKELDDYDEIFHYLLIKLKMPTNTNIKVCSENLLNLKVDSLEDIEFIVEQGKKVYCKEVLN